MLDRHWGDVIVATGVDERRHRCRKGGRDVDEDVRDGAYPVPRPRQRRHSRHQWLPTLQICAWTTTVDDAVVTGAVAAGPSTAVAAPAALAATQTLLIVADLDSECRCHTTTPREHEPEDSHW